MSNEILGNVSRIFNLHECRHSTIVVASTKYPPHSTHMMWGFKSCIFIDRNIFRFRRIPGP